MFFFSLNAAPDIAVCVRSVVEAILRKVVDSNYLQSELLREYLSESVWNFVVLTDYAAMEAYKGDTLKSIFASMSIISEYPRQVIILKSTMAVCGLSGRSAGLQRRLIDRAQTNEFPTYCKNLILARRGNQSLQRQLLDLGREATSHIDGMLKDAATLSRAFEEMTKDFSSSELQAIRKKSKYTRDMIDKILSGVVALSRLMFIGHPKVKKLPSDKEFTNTFIFRAALCVYLLSIRWIAVGGTAETKPENIRNDIIDVNFAAYATYFDGLLTADKKMDSLYQEARYVLHHAFGSKDEG